MPTLPLYFSTAPTSSSVSARTSDDDKIVALHIGGDDYIQKPYSLGVLLAKVKVVLNRFGKLESEPGGKSDSKYAYAADFFIPSAR